MSWVSCRVSDWLYRTDLETMREALRPLLPIAAGRSETEDPARTPEGGPATPETSTPFQESRDSERPEVDVKLVKMAPLDDARIARLACAWDVEDINRFSETLQEKGLEIFARRPRDLEWLVVYWREHGAFGDLADMVELNVRQKLRECNPARIQLDEQLSVERARISAEALAAASVLNENPMIALPDPEVERDLPLRSLWPSDVLPNWSSREIQALLTRGVFDPATFGRVRFHDPMVRHYLAACWMAGKVVKGARAGKVRDLVLRDSFGNIRPVPSKRMVLGWLAAKVPEIRREIATVAPDVLLYCGDASQVPVEERGQALRALAARLREIERTDWTVFDSDVRRIVDPGLAAVIHELLDTEADNHEITHLLLRMVNLGNLSECVNSALPLAID